MSFERQPHGVPQVRLDALSQEKAGTVGDQDDMQRMGLSQVFQRNFSFLPVFGFAATLMVTWEAVLFNAAYVLPNGGRAALIWTFVVSLVGFGAAILSMAEMASMAPTRGGQYHWVSEFAPKSTQKVLSYLIGWFCVLGWQAGSAAQAFGVGLQIEGLIVLNSASYVPQPWHTTLLAISAASVFASFNIFFARHLPVIEDIMLLLHIVGFIAILVPLWCLAPKATSSDVWLNLPNEAGWPTTGLAFCVALTSSIGALIGSDAAVHICEPLPDVLISVRSLLTPRPSRGGPRCFASGSKGMLWTLIVNGISGLAMSITFAYCLGPLDLAIEAPYGFAFIGTFYTATGSHAGTTVMTCLIIVLYITSGIANVATASRQLFAFARDSGLPLGKWWSHIHSQLFVPLNAILLTFIVSALLSLIVLGSTVAFTAILSIGVVAVVSSYLVSISCVLLKRLRGEELRPRRWSLGAWGLPLNVLALAYLTIAFLFAFFPLGTPVEASSMNWACAAYGGVSIVATVYYFLYARYRYVAPVSRLMKDL